MIVTFTDFGLAGPYLGQVKAVFATIAPAVPVIDLFADAPATNERASAYLLAAYDDGFPPGTTFLAVVDPGVGTARRPVVLRAWSPAGRGARLPGRSPGGPSDCRPASMAATCSRRWPPSWRSATCRPAANSPTG